jgi:hypothetical protein
MSSRPQPKPSVPPPRSSPAMKPAPPVAQNDQPEEFNALETGDFELVSHTGDFQATPDKKAPPQKPPRP